MRTSGRGWEGCTQENFASRQVDPLGGKELVLMNGKVFETECISDLYHSINYCGFKFMVFSLLRYVFFLLSTDIALLFHLRFTAFLRGLVLL